MRVIMVVNPRSGRGRAGRLAKVLGPTLENAGFETRSVTLADTEPGGRLVGADLCVAVGGDGTVNALLDEAADRAVPIYHAPMGTENLLARELGASSEPTRIAATLGAPHVLDADLGRVNGRAFAIMASIGVDANVVARLDAMRTGGISKITYLAPIVSEALRPQIPVFNISVDGRKVVNEGRGLLIVANCRRYGGRLDPARSASMNSGALDAVFMPHARSAGAARWALKCWGGMHVRDPRVVYQSGSRIEAEIVGGTAPLQVDGEAAIADASRFIFDAEPGRFPVILGPDGASPAYTASSRSYGKQ